MVSGGGGGWCRFEPGVGSTAPSSIGWHPLFLQCFALVCHLLPVAVPVCVDLFDLVVSQNTTEIPHTEQNRLLKIS